MKDPFSISEIRERLSAMQDPSYRAFQCKLMPSVPPHTVIGVRIPLLRRLAGELRGTESAALFLRAVPHTYYEENNLHAFLIEKISDYTMCIQEVEAFLPYIDNWATCDSMTPKCFRTHTEELLPRISCWLSSEHTYTLRFGIRMLMTYFLEEQFSPQFPDRIAAIVTEDYYVNMMAAWYFATALDQQYDTVLPYLEQRKLSPFVHRKTIQKALESYRIPEERKAYLRSLRSR